MTQPDPHWLELLKASGWQTAAGAIACGALLWANHNGWFPDAFNSWVGPIAVAMAICGSLALASLASRLEIQVKNWHASFNENRELRHSIETLNAGETAFLKNQVEQNQATDQL
jgi:membrane glycosyltransferase